MWDRLRTANNGGGGPSAQQPHNKQRRTQLDHLDDGAGAAWGAYYGTGGTNNNRNNNANSTFSAPKYSYSITGGPAPPRPPREFLDQQYYDEAPPVQAPPPRNPQRNTYRDSSFRPPSSVYSQPSPVNTNFHNGTQQYRYAHGVEDVSPPSSPEILAPGNGPPRIPSPDISPIDEEPTFFDMSRNEHDQSSGGQSRSNIPLMRRERRQNQDAAARTLRETKSRERMHQQQPSPHPDQTLSQRGYKGGEVRWDPNTGELTSSEKGRPSQVKPAEYAKGLGISGVDSSPSSTTERHVEPPKPASSFGDRLRRIGRGGAANDRGQEPLKSPTDPAAGAFTSDRPAWHGASGRTAVVPPVRDTPHVAPLNIPRKSSKRATAKSPTSAQAVGPASSGGLGTIMASPPVSPPLGDETLGRETIRRIVPSSQLTKQPQPPQAQAYPSPPLSGEPQPADSSNNHQDFLAAPRQQPVTNNNATTNNNNYQQQSIKRKPAASHQHQDSGGSVYSQGDPFNYNHYTTATPPQPPPHLEWSQPPSRFSVTTYDATPRESLDEFDPRDAPPVPATPEQFQQHSSPAQKGSSMMDRRRPTRPDHSGGGDGQNEPIVISLKEPWTVGGGGRDRDREDPTASRRKAVGTTTTATTMRPRTTTNPSDSSSARPTSTATTTAAGSVHKSLPPAPPEQSAKDRVTQLNAQLAGLAQRRVNISRSIKQMTELMPTDNLLASADVIHRRELEKRKVEGLRTELAEVQREEYELGLKLHRAYKRLDRDAEFEPTTLWVRRVTG